MRLLSLFLLFVSFGAIGCGSSASNGSDDTTGGSPPDAGGAPGPSTGADGGGSGPSGGDGGAIDTSSDPKNCGFVGHACETTCTKGMCDPVSLRTVTGDAYAIDGGSIYWLDGKNLYAGSVSNASSDVLLATVSSLPEKSNRRTFLTTKSYVYFWSSTGGVTVNKSTHAIATFTFASNGAPFSGVVGNDATLAWYDDNGFLWTVSPKGGTPKATYDWTMTGLAADDSGIYFQGGPQSGDTSGVWKLASSKSTQLAEGVDETFTLRVGASRVYGVSSTGTTSDCMQPSTIWSVPKSGSSGGAGGATTLFMSTYDAAPIDGDDTSLVWSPCSAKGVVALASTGGTPYTILADTTPVQLDGAYAYFTKAVGSSLRTGQLLRVAR